MRKRQRSGNCIIWRPTGFCVGRANCDLLFCGQKHEQIVVRCGGAGCRPRPYQSHVYDNCDECEELLCFSQQLSWQKIFHYKLITTILSVLSVLCPHRVDAPLHPARHFTLCLGSAFIHSFPILICEGVKQTASKSQNAKEKDLKWNWSWSWWIKCLNYLSSKHQKAYVFTYVNVKRGMLM